MCSWSKVVGLATMLLGPAISLCLGNPSIHTCTQYPNSADQISKQHYTGDSMNCSNIVSVALLAIWVLDGGSGDVQALQALQPLLHFFVFCCLQVGRTIAVWNSFMGYCCSHSFVQHRWGLFLLSMSLSLCLWFLSRYSRFSFLNSCSFLLHLFSALKPNTVCKV